MADASLRRDEGSVMAEVLGGSTLLPVASPVLPSSVQVGELTLGQRGGAFSKNVLAFIARDTK